MNSIVDTFLTAIIYLASNFILFLSIAIVIVFVILVIWGFLSGEEGIKVLSENKTLKVALFVVVLIIVIFGTMWALGLHLSEVGGNIISSLFGKSWSKSFWTNVIFIVLIAAALAWVIGKSAKKAS